MTDELGTGSVDWPLDDELARHLVSSQFPELGPVTVTGRYSGVDHYAVELDALWIFRFPKRPDSEPMLAREMRLLPAIGPLLPIAVPRYQFAGTATPAYPFAFAGYRKLTGTPAIACPLEGIDLEHLAQCLGRILSALHGVPAVEPTRLGVVLLDEFEDPASLRDRAFEMLVQVRTELRHPAFDRCATLIYRAKRLSRPGRARHVYCTAT